MTAASAKRGRPQAVDAERRGGAVVGVVVAFARGRVRVTFDGAAGPTVARPVSSIDDAALERAAADGAQALLLFEDGDPTRPLLVGLLRSSTPLVDALLSSPLPAAEKIARVDGKRVDIEGKEEVVLRCGRASLTLRSDGRVVLRGVNLVTQADGVHKIRGGKVQVN